MLYLSIAIVISVSLITLFGINVEVHNLHQEIYEPVEPIQVTSDIFDKEGDEKEQLKGQVSMDDYVRGINDLMVGED